MFCPPEYVHIHEILAACKAAALVHVPYDKHRELIYCEKRPERLDGFKSNAVLRIAQEQELLIAFIEKNSSAAFAYKIGHDPVRVTQKILTTGKRRGSIVFEPNPEAYAELTYVDLQTGKIDLTSTAERMNSWYDEKLYGFSSERRREHFLIQKAAERDFGEIDGWTICFERAKLAFSVKYILDIWKTKRKKERKSKAGAPKRAEPALEVFHALFPNGRGSTHWDTVLDQVLAQGVVVGLSTLQKAVRESEKASERVRQK